MPSIKNAMKNEARGASDAPQGGKAFFGLLPTEVRTLYAAFKRASPDPDSESRAIEEALSSKLGISPDIAASAAPALRDHFASQRFRDSLLDGLSIDASTGAPAPERKLRMELTLEDYQRYLETAQADPGMDRALRRLLLSFAVFYRMNSHPTGWVRYEKGNIFHLAGASKLPASQQERMTAYLHSHCGLDMQVVGSNQPIPCFTLQWMQGQPAPGSADNPMITLGDLTPKALAELVDKEP